MRAFIAMALLLVPLAAAAQGPVPLRDANPPDSTTNFGLKQLAIGAGGLGLLVLLDPPIARNFHSERSASALRVFRQLDRLGDDTGTIPLVGGLAVVGLVTRNRGVTFAAIHAGESVVLAEILVQSSKFLVGRSRPMHDEDLDGLDFHSFGGASPSFPSGHVANAFALATSLGHSSGKKWVTWGLYALATGTAYARLNEQQHWFSDVVAGAAVGIGSAKFVSGDLKIFGVKAPRFIIGPKSAAMAWEF